MVINKIKVLNRVIEVDRDEMTGVIWHVIKNRLIYPCLDIDLR